VLERWAVATLRNGPEFRVFDNSALKRIFGLKREKITGVWSKLLFL
jgi:hypothetical protein